ncbi:MAG TPA: aminodeoxychorismate/anthranilate synthase component II [Bacteroidales bacterium]|nr:aminodeoxychorismate/anthranilate synthase component II [Bacteroidales bacterium]
MRVLLLDNHDSFTYNLVQLLRECGVAHQLLICNCDDNPLAYSGLFDKLILSPGPGLPSESGQLMPWIAHYAPKLPVLGVCLGHQALGEHFGASLKQLDYSAHGERSLINIHKEGRLFSGLGQRFYVGRYHSWVIDPVALPASLLVTATDTQGQIMAFEHSSLPVYGVQFHPESYMTDQGLQIIRNFLLAA